MLFFPHPLLADEDGLLAYGGDLSPERLILAYQYGIFPWYQQDPILWWFTHPRCVLFTDQLKVRKSMRSYLNQSRYKLSINMNFETIISSCAQQKRKGQRGTWLNSDMQDSYAVLHQNGFAHSVEVWDGDTIVGGLYGIFLGKIFYGESMFATATNASKYGFIHLVRILNAKGVKMIDCQQDTPHMRSLGAEMISKEHFYRLIKQNIFEENMGLHDHDLPEETRYYNSKDVLP